MKDALVLLMTPNMSLEKWDSLGQLSRELNYYDKLCKKSGFKLIIYSYGRQEKPLNDYPHITVLQKFGWIPTGIPFRVQNWIYHLSSLFLYRKYFKKALICKTNQFSASGFGLLLKFFYRIPLVVRMGYYYSHFKPISRIRGLSEKMAFRSADLILTTSPEAANYIIRQYRIDPQKLLFTCNNIDLEIFKPLPFDKEWDLIFVGKLQAQKNIALVLEVVNKLNAKTLLIGKGSLEPMVSVAVGNNKNITWKKRVDNSDLAAYYNKAKCFLLLSEYEGNPKVLLEAMACGLPSVVTSVPGIRECIAHQLNGIIVPQDPDHIKTQIEALLSDDSRMKQIGENARHWVKEKCSMSENIDKEMAFYASFLLKNNP